MKKLAVVLITILALSLFSGCVKEKEEKEITVPKLYIMKRVRTYKFGNEISDFVAYPLLLNYNIDYFYKFVVPEGSICREFNIDVEDL